MRHTNLKGAREWMIVVSWRPLGLIEGRVLWPCAGRQGFMPTRRRRTMNKLPSAQETPWPKSFRKETKKLLNQTHFNRLLIKVHTNSITLM
ncbi:rCG31964, isoform CRA_a [Rattus norvegicus]|uniref:RCG31964, isoform CRA_a n=1 Tax=Rattus norvegicus TaxID=10116 RepID=A6KDT8_RAT|nr:rCG31964, isoform CRA_a [Rattus norvegicus]